MKGMKDRNRMLMADVILLGHNKAVGLSYRRGKDAVPKVVCKMHWPTVNMVRYIANSRSIPVVENIELVDSIDRRVERNKEILRDHYRPVATVLAFVYRFNRYRDSR